MASAMAVHWLPCALALWLACAAAPAGVAASPLTSSSFYAAQGSPVVELDPASFRRLVMRSPDWWMVVWYHPHCGHCRLLKPAFAAAASKAEAEGVPVRFGAVNCKLHGALAAENGITYFPALFLYGTNKSTVIEYEGWRSAKSLHSAVVAFAASNGTSIPWGLLDYFVYTVKSIALHYRTISSFFLLALLLTTFLFIYDSNCRAVGRFILYELGLPVDRWGLSRGPPLLPLVSGSSCLCDGSGFCDCAASKSNGKGSSCCSLRKLPSGHERIH